MIKSHLWCALGATVFTLVTVSANAALFSRLGGQAAYDDVLNITWTTNAALSGADTWNNQVAWASNLDYLGFDDWRLASMSVAAGLPTGTTAAPIDCRTATELACRDNELGYMFYQNLGGSFGDNLQGNHTVGDVTLISVLNGYWSGTDGGPPGGVGGWLIGFSNGSVAANPKSNAFNGWAVRDGDVAAVLPLEGRLPATPGGDDYQAYYDPNLDITWAANANINGRDNWGNQMAWAAGLTLGGVSGWRLPSADVNGDNTVIDCSGDSVAGCADNEMGFLFWEEGITAAAPGTFSDVQAFVYWSGTEFDSSNVWAISFFNGGLGLNHTDNTFPAWAVHDGDVSADDSDSDGIVDMEDNCIDVPNGPLIPDAGSNSQLDTDGDGYGNMCDGDLNNDGSTNTLDLNLYKLAHRTSPGDANYNVNADFNGDVVINTLDLNVYKGLHRKPPGPSCCAP